MWVQWKMSLRNGNFFNAIAGCSIEQVSDERYLIRSERIVPWYKSLKAQYNESKYKIGYIFLQKNGVRMDIDFPHFSIDKECITSIIAQYEELLYLPKKERAPMTKSYWRFNSDINFDTFTLVIRAPLFRIIDVSKQEFKELFQLIANFANQRW